MHSLRHVPSMPSKRAGKPCSNRTLSASEDEFPGSSCLGIEYKSGRKNRGEVATRLQSLYHSVSDEFSDELYLLNGR